MPCQVACRWCRMFLNRPVDSMAIRIPSRNIIPTPTAQEPAPMVSPTSMASLHLLLSVSPPCRMALRRMPRMEALDRSSPIPMEHPNPPSHAHPQRAPLAAPCRASH